MYKHRALTKLLLSVDWGVDSEVAQVDGLLAEWARRAPIDAPDALKLLGRERTFQAEVVRRFAVDALRRAPDDELLAFLLQLVQALRYQTAGVSGAGADKLASAAGSGNGGGGAVSSVDSGGGAEGGGGLGDGVSPLAQFLIERACKSLELANFFYWYLRVDLEDVTHGHIYRGVQAAFRRAMRRTPESARVLGKFILFYLRLEYLDRCTPPPRAAGTAGICTLNFLQRWWRSRLSPVYLSHPVVAGRNQCTVCWIPPSRPHPRVSLPARPPPTPIVVVCVVDLRETPRNSQNGDWSTKTCLWRKTIMYRRWRWPTKRPAS